MAITGNAALNAGLGVLSGVFSGIGANKRLDKALSAQKQENDAARKYNKEMAEWQLREQRKDVDNNRAYNTPAAQRARLAAAGLNPDLAYGNGASGLVNSAMPSASAPASVNPADVGSMIMGTPTMADSMIRGLDAMRTLAETKNIEADTHKKTGELASIDLDNLVKSATTGARIESENLNVQLNKSVLKLNEQQRLNMVQELNNLQTQNNYCNQQISESMAKVRNMDSATLNNRIGAYLAGSRFDMEVKTFLQNLKESDARINLSHSQAKEILTLMMSKKLNLDEDTMLKKAGIRITDKKTLNEMINSDILRVTGRQLELNFNSDKEFKDWERALNMATQCFNAVGGIIGKVF